MSGNIIQFTGYTTNDIDAPSMLRAIADEKPQYAIVLCWSDDGAPTYHSSTADPAKIAWEVSKFLRDLYDGRFGGV